MLDLSKLTELVPTSILKPSSLTDTASTEPSCSVHEACVYSIVYVQQCVCVCVCACVHFNLYIYIGSARDYIYVAPLNNGLKVLCHDIRVIYINLVNILLVVTRDITTPLD